MPLNVPATGGFDTVAVLEAMVLGQPPVPLTVYSIDEFPALTPVTIPEAGFTVAIAVFVEVHVPPGVVDVNVVVSPTQTFWVPLKVPAVGGADTATFLVTVALGQPPLPVTV